jgi:hypothetical protein
MTKADFIQAVDSVENLEAIANDTSRMPRERDLARVMQTATLLLMKRNFISAKHILKLSIKELEK